MTNQIKTLIGTYPRVRPFLPEKYKEIYEREYKINREGLSLMTRFAQFIESWMHHQVASTEGGTILEIGAGTLNHLNYEKFKHYDVIEPFKPAYENKNELKKVRNVYGDISEIPLKNKYDKILSVAVFEHLEALPQVIAKSGLLLTKGGKFQNAIPSEGGLLWHLSVALTTGLGFRMRNKVSVSPIMRHEHINTAKEIIAIAKYFYKEVRVKRFPLPLHHLSCYAYIEAREPRIDVINEYLAGQK